MSRGERGPARAKLFANRIFTLLLLSQVILLVDRMAVHAAGDRIAGTRLFADPVRGELAISLTRITFPYLLLITLVTLYGGMLNVDAPLCQRGGGADLPQSVDDGDAGACGLFSRAPDMPQPGAC